MKNRQRCLPGNKLSSEDIKFLNFDNTNIIKAVDCFNKARAKQPERDKRNLDIKKLLSDPDWNKGVHYIEKQFDCHLMVRFFSKKNTSPNAGTNIVPNVKPNITISKSKGFQLHGMPIDIYIMNHGIDVDAPNDISLFGQATVAIFLHEIFHNIAYVFTLNNLIMNSTLKTTIDLARGMKRGKDRRLLFSKYVDTLDDFYGIKITKFNKRIIVKNLSLLSTMNSKDDIETYHNIIKSNNYSDIDKLIKTYEKRIANEKHKHTKKVAKDIGGVILITAIGVIVKLTMSAFSVKGLASYLFYGLMATIIGGK